MLTDTLPANPVKGEFLAQLLSLLETPFANANMTNMIFQEQREQVTPILIPKTDIMPAWYFARTQSLLIVCIGGATSLALGRETWNGYVGSQLDTRNYPTNHALFDRAIDVSASLVATVPGGRATIILCGFSMGGAIATILAPMVKAAFPSSNLQCITFGAPRPGTTHLENYLRTIDLVRWMNDDDWVPLIPPRLAYFTQAGAILGTRVLQRIQNFTQPAGGRMLTTDGVVYSNQLPNRATVPSVSDFSAQLSGVDTGAWIPHRLAEYIRRLHMTAARTDQSARGGGNGSTNEQPRPVSAVAARRAVEEVNGPIFALGVAQNVIGVSIPRPRLWRAVRVGRVWWVYFGDLRICAAPIRKRAQGLANIANEFLRRLQSQAVVDPQALTDQLVEYIRLAADPTSGFTPTLSTQLPPT